MDSLAAIGVPAPDFTLVDLDGQEHRLADQRGTIVVLNFWSAECPHSERVDRAIVRASEKWGAGVAVWWIACNANETADLLRRTARERGIGPVLRDAGLEVGDRYGARTTPHVFVVDAEGILRYAGAPDDVTLRQRVATRDYLAEAVAALLRGEDPQPSSAPPFGCAIVRQAPQPRAE